MKDKIKDILLIIVIVIVAFCMYGVPSFYSPDETRYSEVTREMLANHNFVVPYIDGIIFFHKPPIVYWISCMFMSIFGQNTWGARLVNPVLLGLCLVFTYVVITKVLNSRKIALLSVIVSLSTIMFLFLGRYLNMDLAVAVFINVTMLSYWASLKYDNDYKKSSFWLILAFIFAGFAVMTKGLIGIVFPIAIVGLNAVIMQQYTRLLDIRLYLGLAIVAVISLPWILAVESYYPGFTYYYLVVQQVLRYSTNDQNRDVAKIVYLIATIAAIFPWTFFLAKILKDFSSKQAFQRRKQDQDKWFLFIWAAFIFIFFAFSHSFLFGYLAPIVLPLAILIAMELEKILNSNNQLSISAKISFSIPIFLFLLLPVATIVILFLPMYHDFWDRLVIFLGPLAVTALYIFIKSIKALKNNSIKHLIIYFSLMMIVIANFGYAAGEYFDYSNTYKIANDISAIHKKYPQIKIFESNRFYDIIFYTKHKAIILDDQGELDDVSNFANSNTGKYMMKFDSFVRYWNNSAGLNLLVVRNSSKKTNSLDFKDYKKYLDSDKFYVLDKTNKLSLVASKKIKI